MNSNPSSLSQANQAFFDIWSNTAARAPWMNDLTAQIQSEILSLLPWLGIPQPRKASPTNQTNPVRLLDYACGAGELSNTLYPSIDSALGIDLSPGMVAAYNARASEAGVPEAEMRAVLGDILSGNEEAEDGQEAQKFMGEEYFNFDIAVMSMALHHVPSPPAAVQALVSRLRKGGTVVIIDNFLDSIKFHGEHEGQHGGAAHQHQHQHHHHGHAHNVVPGSEDTITRAGFGKEEMETMFTDAGCVGVEFRLFREESRVGDGEQAVMQREFIVKGTKS
ncbi:MAG: hypothetical protein LQ348_007488 [Seirophora lacunosa]|nr:MAG: hypothetical protein LQ348_007488 [Seirophora lacunosa]